MMLPAYRQLTSPSVTFPLEIMGVVSISTGVDVGVAELARLLLGPDEEVEEA